MSVRTRGLWARLRGSAGVSQSAAVGGLVTAALAISVAMVPLGPRIGSAVSDLFICELGQSSGGQCADGGTQPGGGRRVLLDGADPVAAADPAWYAPAYNSTVYTGPPPATVTATSGAGGERPVNGTPTSMDWCTQRADSAVSTLGPAFGWTSTQFWTTDNSCVDPSGQLRSCKVTHLKRWFNFVPLGTTDTDLGCSNAAIPRSRLACTAAGVDPPQWTCQLAGDTSGRMFHCVAAGTSATDLSCTDANHDTETALAGAPVSCTDNSLTQGLPGDGGRACLGADGTLYFCPEDGIGRGAPAAGTCNSRALSPGLTGLGDCVAVDGGAGAQCTYTGVDPDCTAGPQCPVQRTTVQCAVSRADGKYNHCQDTGGLAPAYLGDASVCEARNPDGSCAITTPVPLYDAGPADHTTAIDEDLDLSVSPDLVRRGKVPNPITGGTSSYDDAVAACTGHEVACRNQVVSDLDKTEATLAKMLGTLGLCATQQECVNPNNATGRKLLAWYQARKAFSIGWTAGSVVLLTALNSAQFKLSSVHFALAGGAGAAIFMLMLAIDKAKSRVSNRVWPASALVDVATMQAAIAAATGPMQEQINRLTVGRAVDQLMARVIAAPPGDVENQLANAHVD